MDIVIDKTGKKKGEIITFLKEFLYKYDLGDKDPVSEDEKKIYQDVKSKADIVQDPNEFSFLLLQRFLDNDTDYKSFLKNLKNVDSELSQEIFEKLEEIK